MKLRFAWNSLPGQANRTFQECCAGWYATNSLYVVLFTNSGSSLIIIYRPGGVLRFSYGEGVEGGFDLFDVYFSR